MTRLLLQSVRAQHPDVPITCHAIPTDWEDAAARGLSDLDVTLDVLPVADRPRLKSNLGWKLVALGRHDEPVVFLDSDMLVLRSLNAVFEWVVREGWFAVREGATLADYYRGEIRSRVQFPVEPEPVPSFNTGLLGFDPSRFGNVVQTARAWADQVEDIWLGDQGLLNLAWHFHHQEMPPCGGHVYNGGWDPNGRFPVGQAVLHFSEPYSPGGNARRMELMHDVWRCWPRGLRLTLLKETEFWACAQPFLWKHPNHCNQARYRKEVRRIRDLSRVLTPRTGVVVEDAYQAFLLAPEVRAELAADWKQLGRVFAGLPLRPTFHLNAGGEPRLVSAQRWELSRLALAALVR